MSSFATRLKELREKKHLTQEELGNMLNISRSSIASWESDRRTPGFDTLQKLADFFTVSLDYLLGRADNPDGLTKEEEHRHYELDKILSEKRVLFCGEPLTLEEKEAVVSIIKVLKQKVDEKEKDT